MWDRETLPHTGNPRWRVVQLVIMTVEAVRGHRSSNRDLFETTGGRFCPCMLD